MSCIALYCMVSPFIMCVGAGEQGAGFLLLLIISGGSPRRGALPGNTSGGSLTVGGVGGKVNMLLGASTDVEAGDVDQLIANADVMLTDQNSGVMDGLGQTLLVDLGLEATLQQFLGG
mmetsp:Transcript_8395/g.18109  ORF Transcript_8395/g.18109 Transcript_8395/m.18109 type:complete len:118 (+) Transcript_8395:55-408(+)